MNLTDSQPASLKAWSKVVKPPLLKGDVATATVGFLLMLILGFVMNIMFNEFLNPPAWWPPPLIKDG